MSKWPPLGRSATKVQTLAIDGGLLANSDVHHVVVGASVKRQCIICDLSTEQETRGAEVARLRSTEAHQANFKAEDISMYQP